jgi:hypothetical protein
MATTQHRERREDLHLTAPHAPHRHQRLRPAPAHTAADRRTAAAAARTASVQARTAVAAAQALRPRPSAAARSTDRSLPLRPAAGTVHHYTSQHTERYQMSTPKGGQTEGGIRAYAFIGHRCGCAAHRINRKTGGEASLRVSNKQKITHNTEGGSTAHTCGCMHR